MRTIETTALVRADGTLTATVPADVAPGEHRVVLVLEESPVVLKGSLELPIHDIGDWPAISLHRADLYGSDGR